MTPILTIISGLAGLVALVCWILVLIPMFKHAGVGLGIVGIITCGLGAFIWGWIKAKELGLTKIMLGWTAAIGVSMIVNILAIMGGVAAASTQ